MNGVRIPADVDREDRLLAGLSGRQLLEVVAAAVVLLVVLELAGAVLPGAALAVVAGPYVALAAVVILGRRDGIGADRFALSLVRHHRRRRLLVPLLEEPPPLPNGTPRATAVGPLVLPPKDVVGDGVVDLGESGSALLCRASSVNFGLRTPDEQSALVEIVANWLNSLNAPVQIVARAERVDVAGLVAELEDNAGALRHPDLEAAARGHATFLRDLASRRDILRREVLLVFRDASAAAASGSGLRRRAEDAIEALAPAGILVTPLERGEALAALARTADPDAAATERTLGWADDDVVRRAE